MARKTTVNNSFEFVATLGIGKKSEKFNPYEEKAYDSGWTDRTLKFNAIAGNNRHMLEVKGGHWKDGHGDVYSFSKGYTDDNGNQVSGSKLQIPWAERLNPERIAEVAEFKKFVVDLEKPKYRAELTQLIEKFKDASITTEEIEASGFATVEDVEKALEESNKKRHEFISEFDFAEYLHKLVNSDKIKNIKFRIRGNIEISEYNGKFYTHLIPTRFYRADSAEEFKSEGTICIYYNKDGFDDGSLAEKGKYYINAFLFNYDNQRKAKIPCPVMLSVPATGDETALKMAELFKKNFTVNKKDGDMWKELGVRINMLDGAQVEPITEDMLSENEQDLLLIGEITMEDIVRDRGGNVYGDRVREWVVAGFAKGCLSGAKPTTYTDDDFVIKDTSEELNKDTDDIFEDDDIDI